jgi:ankyrin repeat protein
VELLLAHAAVDANHADQDGSTALSIATQEGHETVVELLQAHAAVVANQAQ